MQEFNSTTGPKIPQVTSQFNINNLQRIELEKMVLNIKIKLGKLKSKNIITDIDRGEIENLEYILLDVEFYAELVQSTKINYMNNVNLGLNILKEILTKSQNEINKMKSNNVNLGSDLFGNRFDFLSQLIDELKCHIELIENNTSQQEENISDINCSINLCYSKVEFMLKKYKRRF